MSTSSEITNVNVLKGVSRTDYVWKLSWTRLSSATQIIIIVSGRIVGIYKYKIKYFSFLYMKVLTIFVVNALSMYVIWKINTLQSRKRWIIDSCTISIKVIFHYLSMTVILDEGKRTPLRWHHQTCFNIFESLEAISLFGAHVRVKYFRYFFIFAISNIERDIMKSNLTSSLCSLRQRSSTNYGSTLSKKWNPIRVHPLVQAIHNGQSLKLTRTCASYQFKTMIWLRREETSNRFSFQGCRLCRRVW